jgi:hypothetical protein
MYSTQSSKVEGFSTHCGSDRSQIVEEISRHKEKEQQQDQMVQEAKNDEG